MGAYFELILVILTVASIVIAIVDKVFFAKARLAKAAEAPDFASLSKKQKYKRARAPLVADYAISLWPVFLIVLIIRGFIAEPFRVPTGSMLPTIQLNDFILVNKFAYGLRLPLFHNEIFAWGEPKRGDIVVFHYPPFTGVDYIKTVIGVPGDTISYVNKQLYVNGKQVTKKFVHTSIEPDNQNLQAIYPNNHVMPETLVNLYRQDLGGHMHTIYNSPIAPAVDFHHLVIPKGEYFVMGDNRDNSEDSRYWGFVPRKDLMGKAERVLISWNARTDSVRWNRTFKALP